MKFALVLVVAGCLFIEGYGQKIGSGGSIAGQFISSLFSRKTTSSKPQSLSTKPPSRPTGAQPTGQLPTFNQGGSSLPNARPTGLPNSGGQSLPTFSQGGPGVRPTGQQPNFGNQSLPTGNPAGSRNSSARPTGQVPTFNQGGSGFPNVRPTGLPSSGGQPLPTFSQGGPGSRPTGQIPNFGNQSFPSVNPGGSGFPSVRPTRPSSNTGGQSMPTMNQGGPGIRPTGQVPNIGGQSLPTVLGGSGTRPTGPVPNIGGQSLPTVPGGSGTRPTGQVPNIGGQSLPTVPGRSGTRPTGQVPNIGGQSLPSVPGGSGTRPTGQVPNIGGQSLPTVPGGSGTRPTGQVPNIGGQSLPTVPGGSGIRPTGQAPNIGGQSLPSLNPGGTGTRPTGQLPVSRSQTMLPLVSGGQIAPSVRPRAIFPCEKACPICQSLTSGKSRICSAYDDFGDLKQKFRAGLTLEQDEALRELENMTGAWQTTAYLRTCDGLTFYVDLYKDLERTTKDDIKAFLDNVTNVADNAVKKFPREMFSVLDPGKARQVFRDMTSGMRASVCEDLKYYDCFTREAISRNIDCAKALLASGTSLDKADVLALLDVNNCTAWDRDNWNMTIRNFPDVLDVKCMKACPADILMENLRELTSFCGVLDKKVVRALASSTTNKLQQKRNNGTSSQGEKDDWIKLLSDCGADPSFFNNVLDPKDTLKNADLKKVSAAEGMRFMEDALKTMDPSDFSKDEIVNSIGVLVNDRKTLRRMNDSQIEAAACEVCDKVDDMDKEDLIKFSEVVMGLPSFDDPSSFDSSTFDCMGCMMAYMPTSSFDRIPDSSLQSALSSGTVRNMTVTSKAMGKKVLANAKVAFNKPNGDFNDDELKKMGGALSSFSTKDISKIPTASFTTDVVKAFDSALSSDSSSSRSLKDKIIEKVRSQNGGLAMLASTGLAKQLPTSAFRDATVSDFPGITGDNGTSDIQCNKKQAKFLMKLVKNELGEVNATNANYTLRRLTNMKNYLNGLTPSDIKNIGQDTTTCMDKLNAIAKASNMSREQTKTAYEQYKNCTNFDDTDKTTLSASTDSNSISQLAPMVLVHHSSSELDKYGSSNCEAICEKLAEADTKTLSKAELEDKFNFCVKCLGKDTTGDITTDDLDKIGNMICGISRSASSRLDTDSVIKYVPIVQLCSLDDAKRAALANKALSSLNLTDVSTMTASSAIILGNLMTEIDENDLDTIDKDLMSDITDKVSKAFEKKDDTEKKREKCGFKLEKTSADKSKDKEKKKKVLKAAVAAKIYVRASASSTSGRRKRSSTSLTCSDMQTLGTSGLSSMTETQISNLDDQEFIDCADLLGSVTDWTTTQKDALVVVAKRNTVWGSPSAWNSSDVYSAGVMVQSLTTAEIDTLSIDLDAVSRLGSFEAWGESQKQSVFNNWLAAEKSSSPSSITSSELRSLGHITCGASTAQIAQITSTVYRDSADAVGEVTSCLEAQLYEWALLAKTEYGSDVTLWDSTTISNIGVVIGGVTQSEISTLSATQIDSIDANDMSYIPPSIFTGFTASQILTFETAQAQATTTSQRSSLNADQLNALSVAAGVNFSSSSAGGVAGSMLLTTATFFITLALIKKPN